MAVPYVWVGEWTPVHTLKKKNIKPLLLRHQYIRLFWNLIFLSFLCF
ncbi:hypothetical protein Pint_15992 [Pistacia integerrima]|uniref:Uncharacterized protein n=1 Tax=Pistacia integerrima TaxID=434235 RepID=A0ACC0ZE92_9ROSI|nr:hypothetical protein Pint_15992 [Pistacia integerrima]